METRQVNLNELLIDILRVDLLTFSTHTCLIWPKMSTSVVLGVIFNVFCKQPYFMNVKHQEKKRERKEQCCHFSWCQQEQRTRLQPRE